MKKIALLFMIVSSLLFAQEKLRFEVAEKSKNEIKILIKKDKNRIQNNRKTKEVYIVKKGDTLEKISKKYNIPAEQILQTNKIKDKRLLKTNQRLIIEK
ncbi:LysM domain-containing protein [Fusobacterium sp.]|uniref:LysM peptidoglycan-binding domain-containing protein n=1 Tax=Fusobacterium sp. TaxID=68766 RepID=UPI0026201836|nr:LysM domain-containing protein [Fusobacterium sp.]